MTDKPTITLTHGRHFMAHASVGELSWEGTGADVGEALFDLRLNLAEAIARDTEGVRSPRLADLKELLAGIKAAEAAFECDLGREP